MTDELEARLNATKKRYLSDVQCKASAARISAEMKEDREGREKWGVQWAAYIPYGDGTVRSRGKKPLTLIFPGDLEQAQAVINHLYHPEEAAIITANLTL